MPNPCHDPHSGEFATKGTCTNTPNYRGQHPRGTFESQPGLPDDEFLTKYPPVKGKHRAAIADNSQRNGWTNHTDLNQIQYRKEDIFSKEHVKIRIEYNEKGTPIRAYLSTNTSRLLAAANKDVATQVHKWLEMNVSRLPK